MFQRGWSLTSRPSCSKGALLHQRKIEADHRHLAQLEVLLVHLVLGEETTEETGQTGYLEEQL